MKIHEAVEYCLAYHRSNSQINTLRSYEFLLSKFEDFFGDGDLDLEAISSEEILSFLTQLCEGNKQGTKRSRYGLSYEIRRVGRTGKSFLFPPKSVIWSR